MTNPLLRYVLCLLLTLAFVAAAPPCRAATATNADVSVIDDFIAAQARLQSGVEYREARKFLVGNLTDDAAPQTVVLYTIEGQGGSNNYVQYLAVFVRGPNGLSVLTHAEVGGKSVRTVELSGVDHRAIVLATLGYATKDASCCPSVKGRTRYILVGNVLREKPGTAER